MNPVDFLLGIVAGLAISGVTFLIFWYFQRQLRLRLAREGLPPRFSEAGNERANGPTAAPAAPTVSDSQPSDAPVVREGYAAAFPPPSSTSDPRVPEKRPGPPESSRVDYQAEPAPSTVQLSHRVIIHIYRQGRLSPDEVAPRGFTQAGMVEALEAGQGAIAGVLRRLEASGIVAAETAHVQGGSRRVKVYRLTDRGVQLALELRSSKTTPRGRPRDE